MSSLEELSAQLKALNEFGRLGERPLTEAEEAYLRAWLHGLPEGLRRKEKLALTLGLPHSLDAEREKVRRLEQEAKWQRERAELALAAQAEDAKRYQHWKQEIDRQLWKELHKEPAE